MAHFYISVYNKEHFKGKIVLCNCDDPFESNFFKYFALNFNALGLKKLICTCFASSPISYIGLNDLSLFDGHEKMPYMIEISEVPDLNNDGTTDLSDIELLLRNNKNVLTLLDVSVPPKEYRFTIYLNIIAVALEEG